MEHPEVFVSLNGPGIAYGSLQGQKTRVPLSQRFTLLDTVQYLLFRFWCAERIVAVQSVSMASLCCRALAFVKGCGRDYQQVQ